MAFVAREQEFATLLGELDRACSGHGRVVVVIGESGSGKSVLLRRVIDQADQHAARPRTLLSRCYAGDDASPFTPWRQLTSTYPTLESRLPQPLGIAEPAVQGIVELGRRTTAVMVEASVEAPLILAFENIDYADESSLALIRTLAQRVATAPLLLVLTVNAPHPHTSQIAGWLGTIIAETSPAVVELAPIGITQLARYVDATFADEPPARRQHICQTLDRLAGGNLLLLASLFAAIDSGEFALTSDEMSEQLPVSLGSVVSALAGQLSPATMEVLGLAAVAGEEIDLEMLAALKSVSQFEIAEHLDAAIATGLLIDDIDGRIRFRHGAFQQALSRQQPPMRRRLVHSAILDWLRQRPDSRASAIAFHAERFGDFATARTALIDAAAEARANFAYPEAAKFYQRALRIGEHLNVPDVEEDDTRLAMADVLVWNDRSRGIREIDRVTVRARLRGDGLMLARAAQRRATMLYEDGDVTGCLTILVETLPILRANDDHESLATALSYAGYCYGTKSRYTDLEKIAQELLALGEQTGTPMYQAVAYQFLASMSVARGEAGDALGLAIQCVDITEELGRYDMATDYAAVAIVVGVIANLHEPARMKALLAHGEELARMRSSRLAVPDAMEPAFVQARFLYGDWDAVRSSRQALQEMVHSSPRVVRDMIRNLNAEFALAEGRITACEQELDDVARSAAEGSGDHSVRTWLVAAALRAELLLTKRDVSGATVWADAIERVLDEREFAPGLLLLALIRARIAFARGDNATALAIASDLITKSRDSRYQLILIRSHLLAADAQQAAGNKAAAIQQSGDAVVVASLCQLPYEEARARVRRASALLAFGNTLAAREDLDRAAEISLRLGATVTIREIESLMSGAQPGRPAGLTEREVEVIQLVAQGLSDRQIADQLFISHRTVTTHVGNLLGKTQTANRTELAMWAVRHEVATAAGST